MSDPVTPTSLDHTPTLYDRIGDRGLGEIVEVFYRQVLADPELAPMFAGVAMPQLQHMQRELFAFALDAPMEYSGSDIHDVHAHLPIGRRDFSRFMAHLADTLDELEIDDEVVARLVGRLSLYADEIVGGHGEGG